MYDRGKIARHYVCSIGFTLDFISIFPLELLNLCCQLDVSLTDAVFDLVERIADGRRLCLAVRIYRIMLRNAYRGFQTPSSIVWVGTAMVVVHYVCCFWIFFAGFKLENSAFCEVMESFNYTRSSSEEFSLGNECGCSNTCLPPGPDPAGVVRNMACPNVCSHILPQYKRNVRPTGGFFATFICAPALQRVMGIAVLYPCRVLTCGQRTCTHCSRRSRYTS